MKMEVNMIKRIVGIIIIFIVILLAIFAIYRINNKHDSDLKVVRVADATITSLTVAIA